ncbi:MAG: hypothetical protein VST68_00510 [Nitrospirota bacterium]|nr:hypothetical protein [Nitrospirota bacterium]
MKTSCRHVIDPRGVRAMGHRGFCLMFFLMMYWATPALSEGGKHPGFSGMAQIKHNKYVVVHDAKTDEKGPRLGIIKIRKDRAPKYRSLEIEDWKHEDGRSNDLESICALPGRSGEFLMAESGYQKQHFGRLFHITVHKNTARVLSVLPLPLIADNTKKKVGDNFEGLACESQHGNKVLVVLGERGGSVQYPSGVLRWGWFDLSTGSLAWPTEGKEGKVISAPGPWVHADSKRDISDLYIDHAGILWAVATEDPGDNGPYRSVIYQVATIHENQKDPLQLVQDGKPVWIIDGFKIEAISGPAGIPGEGPLSIGTEDEYFGGVWRPLFPAVEAH